MPHILTRALPRAALSTPSAYILPSTRLLSYVANPQARRANPNGRDKIPQPNRPLAREPTPPPTITEEKLAECKWVMRRTPFAQLPVYKKWRSGGTRQEIMVKKVTGDKVLLVSELQQAMDVPNEKIKINPTTGAIIMIVS